MFGISRLGLPPQRSCIDIADTTKMSRANIREASELHCHTSKEDEINDDNTGHGWECTVGSKGTADSNLHISKVNH